MIAELLNRMIAQREAHKATCVVEDCEIRIDTLKAFKSRLTKLIEAEVAAQYKKAEGRNLQYPKSPELIRIDLLNELMKEDSE